MGLMNIPYDPRTDPKALFARGFENMVGGIMRGQQGRNLTGLMEDNPDATPMQMAALLLSKGFGPQISMGMGGLQQRMQPNVGAQPWASTQMNPAQRQRWLDNYGRGITIQTGQKLLTDAEREARAKTEHDKVMGITGPGFSPGDKKAVGDEMDARLDDAKSGFFKRTGGPDYTEDALFREWKKLIAANTFQNDNQRRNTWALWQQKVNKRSKDWFIDNEVDWDPTDPKWLEAIGLGRTPTQPTGADILGGPVREQVKSSEPTEAEINSALEGLGSQERMAVFQESMKLRSIWSELTIEEKISAYEALSQGKTAQEIIDFLKEQ